MEVAIEASIQAARSFKQNFFRGNTPAFRQRFHTSMGAFVEAASTEASMEIVEAATEAYMEASTAL